MKQWIAIGAAVIGLASAAQTQAPQRSEHPFLLWTADEAAAIRKRVETDAIGRRQTDRMTAVETSTGGYPSLFNLF
jgi:hypothetical protein